MEQDYFFELSQEADSQLRPGLADYDEGIKRNGLKMRLVSLDSV